MPPAVTIGPLELLVLIALTGVPVAAVALLGIWYARRGVRRDSPSHPRDPDR